MEGVLIAVEGGVVYANSAAARMLGSEQVANLGNKPVRDLFAPADQDSASAYFEAAVAEKAQSGVLQMVNLLDGALFEVELTAAKIRWEGKPAVQITFHDSARVKCPGSASPVEMRLRALLDATADITFRVSANGSEPLELNGRIPTPAQRAAGQTRWIEDHVHPDDWGPLRQAVLAALDTESPLKLEHRMRRGSGPWRWALTRVIPICDEKRNLLEWFGTVTDITDHKHAQETLLAASSVDRFRATLADALRSFTDAGDLQAAAGQMLCAELGADRVCYADVSDTGEVGAGAEGEYRSGATGAYPGGIDPTILLNCLAGRSTVVQDVLADASLSPAQRKKWSDLGIRAQVTVPWHKEERLMGLMTVYQLSPRNWTDSEVLLMEETAERIGAAIGRARSESLLRRSEERYRGLFNAMADAFCVIEVLLDEPDGILDFQFLEVNWSFEQHTGISNPIGRRMREIAPAFEQYWFDVFAEVARTGKPCRFERATAALEDKWFDVYAFRVGRPEERKVAIIFDDISERRKMERVQAELLEREHAARRLAEAATRAKDDFLAMLSHELRTPLNPVLMVASDAAADESLQQDIRAQFATIRRNVELEARLIDDLLDVTRITRGKMVLEMQVVDAHGVLAEALRTVKPDIEAKEIQLNLDLSAGQTRMLADPVRLQQVLWNILRNAAKFTPVGGRVWVRTFDDHATNSIVVQVVDNGIGMERKDLSLAFEPFVQGRHANETAAHQFGGLGLGLSISKRLAEMHQGTVEAESEGVGYGSTFTVTLPVFKSTAEQARAQGGVRTAINQPRPQGLRILVVEDHEPTRDSLRLLLQRRTHRVWVAGTVADGKQALTEQAFDVLLSDLGLPDGDGHQLAEFLRDMQPKAVAIALSGYGRDDDLARSTEAGFRGHLVKPIAIEKLDDAICDALRTGTD